MSQQNAEIVKAAINALNNRDWDALFQDVAPGAEVDMSRAVGPISGVFKIHQFRQTLEQFAENWESLRGETHEFIEAGDLVVMPWTLHGKGREGIAVTASPTWVWTIREGTIQGLVMYQEKEDALEALGLSKADTAIDSS
jgi:ketosteroid isomerase-like protein